MDRTKAKGYLLMFLSSSAMGGIGAFANYIEAPGLFIAICRSTAGIIMMTLIFLFTKQFGKFKVNKFSPSIIFSGIFLGMLSGLYVMSTQLTTLANAAFLIYTGPVYSTVLAAIFLKEKINKVTIMALVAVFLGAMFIIGFIDWDGGLKIAFDFGEVEGKPNKALGDVVALSSGVAYGLYLFVSRYREDFDSNVRAYTNFIFAVITIGSMIFFKSLNIIDFPEDPKISDMPGSMWVVLIIAAFITGAVAFYLLTVATKILKASELATIAYQETIMASILGMALFDQQLTPLQYLGGALIIGGGVAQILYSANNPEKADPVAVAQNITPAPEGQPH